MKKYIIVIAAILSAAACSQKELDAPQEAGKTRFTAILEDAIATRTYLGDEDEDMYPVFWSAGDKIKLFVSQHEIADGQGYRLDLESGEGTVESVFTGDVPELPDGSLYYYAVYPYSLSASIGGANPNSTGQSPAEGTWDPGDGNLWELSHYVQIPLPSVQTYRAHSFGVDYNPAIAVSRDQTLRFKNACGVLRINLTGNITVGKIVVEGDGDAPLWGELFARYRWRQRSAENEILLYVVNHQASPAETKRITLDCGAGVALSNDVTDFYIVVPTRGAYEGDYADAIPLDAGFTIRIYDTSGNEVFAKHTDADNTIHRSMIRNMPTLDVRSRTYTALSAYGTANSYIVRPDSGTYSFYAGNMGNSPQPVSESSSVLANAHAVVLWETRMSNSVEPNLYDVITNVSYNTSTHYITFNTTSNPGNALIALKDETDRVLWSWHIWSTDYDPSTTYDTYGTAVMMDRNLGALRADTGDVSFYGLYYQWGRKDPFGIVDFDPASLRFSFYPSSPFGCENSGKTIEEIIAHPTIMYSRSPDLYSVISGTTPQRRVMDNADIAELWGKEKTKYDPCPPGWQVADLDAYYQFTHSFSTDLDFDDHGDYAVFESSSVDAVYPTERAVWTNHHHRNCQGAIHVNIDLGRFELYRWSCGINHVRCQRSDTVFDLRDVVDLSASGTSNCYMARPKNKYKFNAMVKGNSGISTGMPSKATIAVITENSTGVTWDGESFMNEHRLITDCYLKDGYIYFTTSLNDVYGNAMIVLKDERDNILWSWHIWIVDYNPESNYDTIDWGEVGDKKFMKMNLGALNNEHNDGLSMGLMYQWGRKDPFMGAVAYDSNTPAFYERIDEYITFEPVAASVSNSTLSYAIKHPGHAIMDEAEGDGDWLDEHENALWGAAKTFYDPCPPGWKVPARPIYGEHSVSSVYLYGMEMDGVWYPATGYRHRVSSNLNEVGQEGHYWYSTPRDDGHAYSFYFNSGSTIVDLANHYSPKAQLNAIRCMKDE